MPRLLNSKILYLPMKTRMPFRYGIATMTDLPLCLLFLKFGFPADNSRVAWGMASDFLPPRWFKKDPSQAPLDEVEEMKRVIGQAVTTAESLSESNPFAFCLRLYQEQEAWGRNVGIPPLLANFGASLVERTLLDANCRMHKTTLHSWLHQTGNDLPWEQIHPELKGIQARQLLPSKPLESVVIRHTLGFGDPLTEAELDSAERLEDPLPQTLETAIKTYGLTQFKVKIKANPDEDLERLLQLSSILQEQVGENFRLSLDGNEQFSNWAEFATFWEQARQHKELVPLLDRILFIEQPLSRDSALEETNVGRLPGGRSTPPVIIDESDAEPEVFRRALDFGYRGVSHKNCKGLFKGIAHRLLIGQRSQNQAGPLIMSGEDLANIGPVALPQDLALQAILGNSSVERNGHHYFFGLSMFPFDLRKLILERHPDLYRDIGDKIPSLDIRDGELSLDSINQAPLGTAFTPEELYRSLQGESL